MTPTSPSPTPSRVRCTASGRNPRPAQCPGPEVLDFELRVLLRQLTAIETFDEVALCRAEPLARGVDEGAHGDHRKPRVELHRRHRIARRRPDEGALEVRVRDRFM